MIEALLVTLLILALIAGYFAIGLIFSRRWYHDDTFDYYDRDIAAGFCLFLWPVLVPGRAVYLLTWRKIKAFYGVEEDE